jgi:hypothetical protein
LGASTITASVVKNIAAELTAFSKATLSTFAGSIIHALKRSLKSHSFASKPKLKSADSFTFSTTRSHLYHALFAI